MTVMVLAGNTGKGDLFSGWNICKIPGKYSTLAYMCLDHQGMRPVQ
jgi:hypothetical protein